MHNFALIGAAGYVAPRHMRAIKETGNKLLIAMDPNDSVGILDSHFPDAWFYTEFERFDRGVDKLRRQGTPIEYVSICSPNYLHDAHTRFALRNGAHVICEKPVVLNTWNLDALMETEQEGDAKAYTILQLRHHPTIEALRERVQAAPADEIFDIDLTYITSRGKWYFASWKGDMSKSGGIVTNIGVHFFDMLIWVFGGPTRSDVHIHNDSTAAGYLELERARIRWFMSVDAQRLPESARAAGKPTYRSITIGEEELEFSEGFTDLHTRSYQEIMAGRGFSLADARPSIDTVSEIRRMTPLGLQGEYHPFAKDAEA